MIPGLLSVAMLLGGCKVCRYIPVAVEVRESPGDAPAQGVWVRAWNVDPRPLAPFGCRGRLDEPWVQTDAAGRAVLEMERTAPIGVLLSRDGEGSSARLFTVPAGGLRPADLAAGSSAVLSGGASTSGARDGEPSTADSEAEFAVRVWRE